MKDVIFINPPFEYPYATDIKQGVRLDNRNRQPLDLAYAAAVLLENGFSADIIDANILRMEFDEIIKDVEKENPTFVVITTSPMDRWECPYLDISAPLALMARLKSEIPDTKVIATGPHGTTTPDWIFQKSSDFDVLIRGEPEYVTLDLAKFFVSGEGNLEQIKGISYRNNGNVVHNVGRELIQDLDALPFPAYHLLPMDRYLASGSHYNLTGRVQHSILVSTRGCPHSCTYCLRGMWGRQFRRRSPQKIVDEIEMIVNNYGINYFYFI